ncbi:hypothetical protein VK92_10125 [Burkholderia sp. LK4]|nr:hypothetical protein VL00_24545 [Burkholderia cepacia]KMN60629.1 hypothetical protein VK92_10125 [Burkholderia sp. LK4]
MPLQPGMTLGELARLFNACLHIGAAVTVVPMANYARAMRFDDTAMPRTNGSMRFSTASCNGKICQNMPFCGFSRGCHLASR